MGYVGWGLVAEQANTTTGGAQRTVGITSSPGAGIAQSSLNAVNNGGGGVINNYGAVWDNLFVRQYLFGSGEQGVWLDPSDFQPNWRRNLLTWTEDFSNAAWTKGQTTVTPNATTAPDGTLTADKLVEDTSNALHNIQAGPTVTSGVTYTASIYLKAAERTSVTVRTGGGGLPDAGGIIDLSTGVISSQFGSPTSISITSVGNSWHRVAITNVSASTAAGRIYVALNAASPASPNGQTYTGNGTSGIFIWGAQLEVGSTATAYQPITDGIVDYLTYQPQPILYQDSAGVTPVTALEQPCGLMLDKSKGLQLGPELVVNGDFSSSAGWNTAGSSWTVAGGVASNTGVSGNNINRTDASFVAGRIYLVTFEIVSITAGGLVAELPGVSAGPQKTTAGTYRAYITAKASGTTFFIYASGGNFAGSIDNVSIRELPGNHAYQTTSAKRPVVSARVNLLTYTEQFDNAAWTKLNATITPNATTAPDGTLTADLFASSGGETRVGVNASLLAANRSYTASISGKFSNANGRYLWFRDFFAALDVGFDLQNGVVSQVAAGMTASVVVSEQGFYRCIVTWTTPGSAVVNNQQYWVQSASGTNVSGGVSGGQCFIWGADLRPADQATGIIPRYQRVGAATYGTSTSSGVADYDSVGFPVYLRTDGIDDAMLTNSIDFTATDKMTVWAGVRKLSDAAQGVVTELSATSASNNGTFTMLAPDTPHDYSLASRGTTRVFAVANGFDAPLTNVVTGIGEILTDTALLRINGAQVASNTGDQGTGNYGNYPLYLFARNQTSLYFNGNFYGLIVRGAQTPASLITLTEEYISGVTGFGAPVVVGSPSIGVSI